MLALIHGGLFCLTKRIYHMAGGLIGNARAHEDDFTELEARFRRFRNNMVGPLAD